MKITEKNLCLRAPIERWDEAIPLGNGLLGGLLWGSGSNLKLSLDRGDLWDLRSPEIVKRPDWTWATIRECVAQSDQKRLDEMFHKPYGESPYPTKISVGRLEFAFAASNKAQEFSLDLDRAVGCAVMSAGHLEVFFSAVAPVIAIKIHGAAPKCRIVLPAYGGNPGANETDSLSPGSVARLAYPEPQYGRKGAVAWARQVCADGLQYAVVMATRRGKRDTQFAITVTATRDGSDPVAAGRQQVCAAIESGSDRMLKLHEQWWRAFWKQSRVSVPDAGIQRHYDLAQYFYGAASRRGAPPIPLQGVWTADEGTLPPWKGDYHNDLNTELTYWAYLAANHLEEGRCFLDFMWNLLPAAKTFARRFYGLPGACAPGVMALDGAPMGGWCMYSFSPTTGAWIAHAFYMHWRYTMDREFLEDRAYPYCREMAEFIVAMLEPDKSGKLKLPLSSSPEIHDEKPGAWLTPNSNFDLGLMRWLFGAMAEMADRLGARAEVAHWKDVLGRLDDLAVDIAGQACAKNALRLSPDESLTVSHRHFSHLVAIYPLGILHVEGGDRDKEIVEKSLLQLDVLGTGMWCGYSFSWAACLAARSGQADKAWNLLDMFLRGFVSRNGFHLNGDYRNLGLSAFKYRPFTLEGNFAAAQAVHEMLMQSWGGVVRIFPAIPAQWRDVGFERLRAEGAFIVSARRRAGRTVSLSVKAEQDGPLRLRNPFGKLKAKWNVRGIRREGADIVVSLRAGQVLEGRLLE